MVLSVLDIPLSLNISVPAQTPNWSVVADTVTLFSRLKRSPQQCRERFIPREDPTLAVRGQILCFILWLAGVNISLYLS